MRPALTYAFFFLLQQANAKAAFLNEIVDGLESTDISDSDVVKDLVSSFLLPEVSRSELRSQVHTHTHTHKHTHAYVDVC